MEDEKGFSSVVWLGIDFSGNAVMWSPHCRRSNVWVARVEESAGLCRVTDLCPVQELPGPGLPFDRLVALLRCDGYTAAGIDAPFSIPAPYVPGDHLALVRVVGQRRGHDVPFPSTEVFFKAVGTDLGLRGKKVFRSCERYWQRRGVHPRSTLWAGPRGGAAFTAACLTLLDQVRRPAWPWASPGALPCLVEAFPAAQLKVWGLPYQRYNGSDAVAHATRQQIVAMLSGKVQLGAFRSQVAASADALDAVVAAWAAVAVSRGRLLVAPGPGWEKEGWIAVHK